MPRNSAGYSRDDWRNMLVGAYLQLISGTDRTVIYAQEVEGDGPFLLLYTTVGGRSNAMQSVEFTDDTVSSILDISRPRSRLVPLASGVVMVRPLVRRTRRKGLHPEDYEVHFLNNNHRGNMSRVLAGGDRHKVALALLGPEQEQNTTVRGGGSLAIVSVAGDVPVARLSGMPQLNTTAASVIGQLASRLGYGDINVPHGMDLPESVAAHLADMFGLVVPGVRLYWYEAVIGRLAGNTLLLDEGAELLSNMVSQNYPEYEVQVNAAGV